MSGKSAVAEAAILATAKGRNLQAIVQGGGSLGVSMRGIGTVVKETVQDDYVLEGVDVVMSPSFNAYISKANVFESEEFSPARIAESVERRWEQAVRQAGFKGSLQDFEESLRKNINHEELDRLFHQAVKSGFRGTFADYRDNIFSRRK